MSEQLEVILDRLEPFVHGLGKAILGELRETLAETESSQWQELSEGDCQKLFAQHSISVEAWQIMKTRYITEPNFTRFYESISAALLGATIALEAAGLYRKQSEVAELVGVCSKTVGNWKRKGDIRSIGNKVFTADVIRKAARA